MCENVYISLFKLDFNFKGKKNNTCKKQIVLTADKSLYLHKQYVSDAHLYI